MPSRPHERFVWGGYYELGLIWRSRWVTDGGVVECREALALPSDARRVVILRRIIAVRGDARVDVVSICARASAPARRGRCDAPRMASGVRGSTMRTVSWHGAAGRRAPRGR